MEQILEKIECGAKFKIDFATLTAEVNHKKVDIPECEDELDIERWSRELSILYKDYWMSRPSQSDQRHSYFEAATEKELYARYGAGALMGNDRDVTRFKLEWFVLQSVKNHPELLDHLFPDKKHFWVCPENENIVILKKWFNK